MCLPLVLLSGFRWFVPVEVVAPLGIEDTPQNLVENPVVRDIEKRSSELPCNTFTLKTGLGVVVM